MAFDPELYCALHTGTPGDTEFYARIARNKRVLELGCGDGRVSEAMVSEGTYVASIELHPGMLERARQRWSKLDEECRERWHLEAGDMRTFDLARRFDLVVIPYSGIFCLNSHDKEMCFKCVADHLELGGRLVLDTYATEGIFDGFDHDSYTWQPLTMLETSSGLVLVQEREYYGPGQVVTVDYRFELMAEEENIHLQTDTIIHHCFQASDITTQLNALGFRGVSLFADFEFNEYGEDAEQMIIVATLEG